MPKQAPKQTQPQQTTKEKFDSIRNMYKKRSEQTGLNILLYGDFGTGKTYSLHTLPKPVYIHSFDPGGSVTLRKWVDSGEVIVDSRFETDDRNNPEAYRAWEKEFNELRGSGFFEEVGTYVIDSLTTFSSCLMAAAMSGNKDQKPRNSKVRTFIPQLQDYQIQMYTIEDVLKICTGLPCNFVCTAHIQRNTDEVTGAIISSVMITGKLSQKLPLLFDEVYVTDYKNTSKGPEYFFQIRPTGMHKTRSRIAANADFDATEPQNFSELFRKGGIKFEDKPLLNETNP